MDTKAVQSFEQTRKQLEREYLGEFSLFSVDYRVQKLREKIAEKERAYQEILKKLRGKVVLFRRGKHRAAERLESEMESLEREVGGWEARRIQTGEYFVCLADGFHCEADVLEMYARIEAARRDYLTAIAQLTN